MSDHTPRLSSDQDYWDCLSIYHTAVMAIPLIDLSPARREAFLGLAKKIYFHAASIHTLSKGTAGPEYNFVDHQSISALVRTFVESYAQLNHVFLTEPF